MKRLSGMSEMFIICTGSDCKRKGAQKIRCALRDALKKVGRKKGSLIIQARCTGFCSEAPVFYAQCSDTWITKATPRKVKRLVQEELGA